MNLNKLGVAVKRGVCGLLMPCFLAFSFSGCSSGGKFALKCGENQMSPEEFSYIVTNTILSAPYKIDTSQMEMSEQLDLEKLISEGSIEGQPAADWVKEQAMKSAKNLLAVREECKKLNKELPDDQKQSIQSSIEQKYDESGFSELNVSKETIQQYTEDYQLLSIISEEYFAEGKPKYVDDERVDQYSKEHGLRYKVVELNKLLDSANLGEEFGKILKNEGVSNVKELATKYMDQISKGKTIDDIDAAFNKLFQTDQTKTQEAQAAPDKNFVFSYDDSNESAESQFVKELQPGSPPALKEDEHAYYIIQRFELDQATIEKQRERSRSLLSASELKNFLDELTDKCEITVNKEVVDKVDILEQTKVVSDALKKMQENRMNKMSQDQEDSDDEGGLLPQGQEGLDKDENSSSQASDQNAQGSQSQSSEQQSSSQS